METLVVLIFFVVRNFLVAKCQWRGMCSHGVWNTHTHLAPPIPHFHLSWKIVAATPSSEKVMVLLGSQKKTLHICTHIYAHFCSHGILYSTPHILYSSAVERAVGLWGSAVRSSPTRVFYGQSIFRLRF